MGEQWIQMTGALVVLYLLFTSSVLTTTLAPHCGAFSRALKIEKIKGPLFPGPEGREIQMAGALTGCPVSKEKDLR